MQSVVDYERKHAVAFNDLQITKYSTEKLPRVDCMFD